MPIRKSREVVDAAAMVRARAKLKREAFSTQRMVQAMLPRSRVRGADLPLDVMELAAHTPRGELILYSRQLEPPDQRFVIAHALGHFIFDDKSAAAAIGFVGNPHSEARADAFAGELLVPLERLAALVDRKVTSTDGDHLDQIDRLASRFRAPRWLIKERIQLLSA